MTEAKTSLREKLLKQRQKLSQKDVEIFSKQTLKRLTQLPEYKRAHTILLYHPIQNEVDTTPLLLAKPAGSTSNRATQQSKTFCLPRICGKTNRMHIHKITDPTELIEGRFNVKEPQTSHPVIARAKLDLIITPGIAFDPQGNRIGYGKGYFDKLFKTLSTKSTKCTKIALAYDFQIVENIPVDKHDQKVDLIVTDKRTINP